MVSVLLAAVVVSAGFTGCTKSKESVVDTKTIELSTSQLNEIETQIDKILYHGNYNGAALVKLNKNLVYDKCFGSADNKGSEVTEQTVFNIGSVTRAFTGAAIYKLVDQKKLSLDSRLDSFFSGGTYLSKISVGQLLDGTVKMTNYTRSIYGNPSLEKKLSKAYKDRDDERIKRLIAAEIISKGNAGKTGTVYSNYYLLGLIIEEVSGMSYKKYIKTEIFDKLGMKNSGFVKTGGNLKCFDMNNKRWRNQGERHFRASYGYFFSSFGITSTAEDMVRFCSALMAGTLTKTDIIKSVRETGADFNCGIYADGQTLYMDSHTYLSSAYISLNPEDLETVVLVSNYSGKIDFNSVGKDVAQTVKTKINGMVLSGK